MVWGRAWGDVSGEVLGMVGVWGMGWYVAEHGGCGLEWRIQQGRFARFLRAYGFSGGDLVSRLSMFRGDIA